MKKYLIKGIVSLSLLSLSMINLASCSKNTDCSITDKALIRTTTNQQGTIKVIGIDENNYAELNTKLTVEVTSKNNYRLDSLYLDETDITSSLAFTPTAAKTYILNATFLPTADSVNYTVELTGDRQVEIGKTMQLSCQVSGPDSSVSYFVSDPDLARVDDNGLVTAKKAGFVTVTATAINSNSKDPATDSFSFFVEPHYIARMVESMTEYSLTDTLSFNETISFCYLPSSGSNPESSAMKLPYTVSIIKDENKKINVDFHLDFGENTSLLNFGLPAITGDNNLGSVTRLGFLYESDTDLQLYAMSGANHDSLCYYNQVSIAKDLAPTILNKLLSSLTSGRDSSSLLQYPEIGLLLNGGKNKSIDLASLSILINTVLTYDEDPSSGISVSSLHLATLQTLIDSLKAKAILKPSMTNMERPLQKLCSMDL